jgi:iron complex outermembrane receptor protein
MHSQTRRVIWLAGISGLAVLVANVAQAADAAVEAKSVADVDEVIVTGTRSTQRTVTQSLAPIDVLSAQALQRSGKISTRDLISTLVPSANTSNSGAGASFAIKTLSLRGLPSDQALVLVNGKRRHNTSIIFVNGVAQNGQSPPDLDLIPSASIARIEVLRDGASAQYGSDAIAGVVNIILKEGGGGSGQILTGATGGGDGKTLQGSLNYGYKITDKGFINVTLNAQTTTLVDRGDLTPNTTSPFYPLVNGQINPKDLTFDRHTAHPGAPASQLYVGEFNAEYDLTDHVKLYSFGTLSSRYSAAWLTFRTPQNLNNVIQVLPDGYSPRLFLHDRDYQGAVGFKGDAAGFNWDLSTTYGRNKNIFDTNSLNVSLGPASPTYFYAGTLVFKEWTSNFDVTREFDVGLYKPMFVAAGVEYRKDTFVIKAGQPESYLNYGFIQPAGFPNAGLTPAGGSQGVSGFPASAAGSFTRDNKSAYLNIEQKLAASLEVSAAGRFEHYSDFGSTETYKVSARWEPIENYAIRGTISTGFRAPSLQQEHYGSSSTIGVVQNGVTVLAPVQLLPPTTKAAQVLGATPLRPEKSTSYAVGLIMRPVSNLNITLDVYQIKIRNRILQTATLGGTAVSNALIAQGLSGAQQAFFYTNAADTITRGTDLVIDYRTDLGDWGSIKWTASGNINKSKFTRVIPPAFGIVLISRQSQGNFTESNPKDKEILSADYTNGKFESTLRVTRYGKVTTVSTTPALDDVVSPVGLVDLDLSYQVTEAVRVGIGANNLLNTHPDLVQPANRGGASPFTYYNQTAPYGIAGGFYYAKINVDF